VYPDVTLPRSSRGSRSSRSMIHDRDTETPLLNLSYFIFGHFVIVHFEHRPNNSIAGELTLSLINLSGKFLRSSASPGHSSLEKLQRYFLPISCNKFNKKNLIFIITFVRKRE